MNVARVLVALSFLAGGCNQAVAPTPPTPPAPVALIDGQSFVYALALDASNVYVATMTGTWRLPRDGSARARITTDTSFLLRASDGQSIYWHRDATMPGGGLFAAPTSGGAPARLDIAVTDYVIALAADDTDLYWTAGAANGSTGIFSAPKTGGAIRQVADAPKADGPLILDATHVYVATDAGVLSVPKAGGTVTVSMASMPSELMLVKGLAVGSTNIFFNDGKQSIFATDKNGGSVSLFTGADRGALAHTMAVDDTYLYYWERLEQLVNPSARLMAAPLAGGAPSLMLSGPYEPLQMFADRNGLFFSDGQSGAVYSVPR